MIASQKNAIKRSAKKNGMHVVGNFLIASRSEDVVSGLAIDGTPAFTYIWTFVLPTYDDLSFLHMTLGERVATCGSDDECFSKAYSTYRQSLDDVKSADGLIKYLDRRKISGEYSNWVRFISLVRSGDFAAAESALEILIGLPMTKGIRERVERVRHALRSGGWSAVQRLLGEWSMGTKRLLGDAPIRAVANN